MIWLLTALQWAAILAFNVLIAGLASPESIAWHAYHRNYYGGSA